MKLPNGNRAFVDIRKLRFYCLDPSNPKGRNKARVFGATLGIGQLDSEFLRDALLKAAAENDCQVGETDDYGQRFTLDTLITAPAGIWKIRSGWIIRQGEDFPRLTTCYVLKFKRHENEGD